MAKKERELIVRYSVDAALTLEQIWNWNARKYDEVHADAYLESLRREIAKLKLLHASGRFVPGRADLRYMNLRKKPRSHGHVAVYRVVDNVVEIVNLYHTAQNWQEDI